MELQVGDRVSYRIASPSKSGAYRIGEGVIMDKVPLDVEYHLFVHIDKETDTAGSSIDYVGCDIPFRTSELSLIWAEPAKIQPDLTQFLEG